MDYSCRDTIIQTMKDFGCEEGIINDYMKCFDRNDQIGQEKVLTKCRSILLEELHQKQKQIDLLDYMVYQMEKCHCKKQL